MNGPRANSGLTGPETALSSGMMVCVSAILLLASVSPRVYPQAPVEDPNHGKITISQDGTVTVPSQSIPPSGFLSPEGKAYVAEHMQATQESPETSQAKGTPYLEDQKAKFPVDVQDTSIAGVHVYIFTPKDGVKHENSKRILIDLHGGGFTGCWPDCALMESMPVSSVGKFKVVSVDYREGPKYHFPAANEDVAKVYSALLKQYSAKNIGIYGFSAGGTLTAESIAWFEKYKLPIPGAIGIFCAGGGDIYLGDSMYLSMPVGQGQMFGPYTNYLQQAYWGGADANDPLVQQVNHPDVLAKFPPTLFISGTRDVALSNVLITNLQLLKAGVETKLIVWEGLWHGFFFNPNVPESQDAYREMVKFFDNQLAP